MSKIGAVPAIVLLAASLGALGGCRTQSIEIPDVPEQPSFQSVQRQDFVETAPGYGIYSSGAFQINLESEDAPFVHEGQKAVALSIPGHVSVPCRVARVLRAVTAETRQGIAWLRPDDPRSAWRTFKEGDFVFATITTKIEHGRLAIPRAGVFIKDSKTWAVEQTTDSKGKPQYTPVEIETGLASGGMIEVLKGLQEGQVISVDGAIGYQYPDFKANADD